MPHELAVAFVNPANQKRADDFGVYGYELTTNENSLTFPVVIVQVLRRRRIADHYMKMIENPELRRRATLDLLKKQGIESRNIADITFQTNRHLLCFSVARTDTDGEKVRSLEGIYFTETGSINVLCFAEADSSSKWAEVFSEAMHSIEIAPPLQFHQRPVYLTGVSFRIKNVLLIPGIMVAVGLLKLLANRFGNRVMSDEI